MGKTIKEKSVRSVLYLVEDCFCIAAIVLLALIPLMEAAARIFFKTGILGTTGYTSHLLLLTGLVGAMICTRHEGHLAISLAQYIPEGRIKEYLKIMNGLVSAFVAMVIAWSSVSFVKNGLDVRMIGIIPLRVFASIIPISFFIIAIRFARRVNLTGWKIIIPVFALFLATFAAFPAIAGIIWGIDDYDWSPFVFNLCENLSIFTWYAKLPLIILFILAALGGTPLFIVMGGLAMLLMFASGGKMESIPSDIYSGLTSANIIAIPLFTMVGFFLSESKAGERLVNTFRSFFSWLPGGIIIVCVIICAFFTSFTGASGVTILALGGILYVILNEHLKYPEKFSIGLLTSVGSIGLLFPPSLPIILVGTISQTNIFHLFIAGVVPGFILIFVTIVFGIIVSYKAKLPLEKFDALKSLVSLKKSIFEILLPVILIVCYFSGLVTSLVELSAIAFLYIFIIEVVVHRDIKLSDIKKVFDKAFPIIGGVLAILAVSKALSYYIVDTRAPMNIAAWMHDAISSKIVFLLLLNAGLLLVGCLMDIFSAILIVLPLIIPLGQIYGIDPVHLGIIFLINLEAGYLTPPVGLNLFLATYRFKKPFVEICRNVAPFLVVRLAVVLLVTYIPQLSTFLVSLIGR
ncbi:MAG: TRAP transporter large permease subunit [Treponema sp.]|nr:TRAP transporter large permease subunit [Treponema sp.]